MSLRRKLVRGFAGMLGVKLFGGSEVMPGVYDTNLTPSQEVDLANAYQTVNSASVAMRRIIRDCAGVRLVVARAGTGSAPPVPLPDTDERVRLFRRANPNEGGITLQQRFWMHLIRRGTSYFEFEYLGRRTPQELYVVAPESVKPMPDEDGIMRRFRVRLPSGRFQFLEANRQLLQIQLPSPTSEYEGQSDVHAALKYMQTEKAAVNHNLEFFKTGSRPAGVLETPDDLDPDEVERMRQAWHDKYEGPKGIHRIPILFKNTKYVKTFENPKEADYVEGSKLTREQILSAAGVPPALAGVFEYANYANTKEQKRLYWHNTVIPLLVQVAQELTERALPNWGDQRDTMVYFDLSDVEALQEMRIDRATALVALVGGGVYTPNEAREELGKPRVIGGDTLRLPQTLAPVGSIIRPPAVAALGRRGKGMNDPARKMRRKDAATRRDTLELSAQRLVEQAVEQTRARVLAAVEANVSKAFRAFASGDIAHAGIKAKLKLGDIWDQEVESDAMRDTLVRMYTRIVSERGPQAAEDAGAEAGAFLSDDPLVLQFIEENAYANGRLITGTSRDLLEQVLKTWVDQGETTGSLTKAIEDLFDLRHHEAQRIARTETTSAYNFSTTVSWAQTGVVTGKAWLTAEDDEVRDEHDLVDGETVGLDEDFVVGGEECSYPGDNRLSAGLRINCRCTLEPTFAGEEGVGQEAPAQVQYRISPKALADWLGGKVLTAPGAATEEPERRNGVPTPIAP